ETQYRQVDPRSDPAHEQFRQIPSFGCYVWLVFSSVPAGIITVHHIEDIRNDIGTIIPAVHWWTGDKARILQELTDNSLIEFNFVPRHKRMASSFQNASGDLPIQSDEALVLGEGYYLRRLRAARNLLAAARLSPFGTLIYRQPS